MLKAKIKLALHKLLGFERFLYYFSLFKINTLKYDKNENDIFLFIFILNELKKEGIVLDVGANIGIMTGVIAKKSKFNIHAFEPLPINYSILEKVVSKLNIKSRVTLHQMALGSEKGFCEMVLPVVDQVRMHGLSHVVDPSITEFNTGTIIANIPIDTLDNLFRNTPILGIKLDVENFEYNVLKGADSLLKSQKPVIYTELWDNENRLNCFKYLRRLGYKSYTNKNGKLHFFEGNETGSQTFFFI